MKKDIQGRVVGLIVEFPGDDTSETESSNISGIRSRGPTAKYDAGWERIFGQKDSKELN